MKKTETESDSQKKGLSLDPRQPSAAAMAVQGAFVCDMTVKTVLRSAKGQNHCNVHGATQASDHTAAQGGAREVTGPQQKGG